MLKNGELRQVLEVQSLNFALKSEQEQAAIVYQYQAFLNSLQFPVQILVQSRRLDLTRYLVSLRNRISQTPSPLLRNQIADYADFVGRLITLGDIMEKHFYVTVPYASGTVRNRGLLPFLKKPSATVEEAELTNLRNKLSDRVASVQSGLGSIGLQSTVLSGEALVKLLYQTYNPAEAGEIAIEPPELH